MPMQWWAGRCNLSVASGWQKSCCYSDPRRLSPLWGIKNHSFRVFTETPPQQTPFQKSQTVKASIRKTYRYFFWSTTQSKTFPSVSKWNRLFDIKKIQSSSVIAEVFCSEIILTKNKKIISLLHSQQGPWFPIAFIWLYSSISFEFWLLWRLFNWKNHLPPVN